LRFIRLLPWLVISLCPPLLGHCGGALEHGTETGNPPVVEQQKLHVVLHDDGVQVVGEAGSVSAGATVTVTNTRNGDHAEAIARADGSLSVNVPGTLDDEYEVTVTSAGASQTVQVSAGAGASAADLARASCDALAQSLNAQVTAGYAAASKACQVDSDCTTGGDVGCYFACNGPSLSRAGEQAAQQSLLESTAPLCAELTRRCTPAGPIDCPPPVTTPGCNDGACQILSCADLQIRMGQRLRDIQEQVPRDCAIDADCALINPQVRCLTSCSTQPIVQAGIADQTTPLVQSADDSICGKFALLGCPAPIPPPCVQRAEPRAACAAGQCEIAYTPEP
jgi:hypothetical protein